MGYSTGNSGSMECWSAHDTKTEKSIAFARMQIDPDVFPQMGCGRRCAEKGIICTCYVRISDPPIVSRPYGNPLSSC